MFNISIGQMDNAFTSENILLEEINKTDPKWPDCVTPTASLVLTSRNDGIIEIEDYDEDLEYQLVFASKYTSDSILFDVKYDNIHSEGGH